jgi:hypothetical protein
MTCTAVAPDDVFTVGTYGDTRRTTARSPGLVRKSHAARGQTCWSTRRSRRNFMIVIKVGVPRQTKSRLS